MRMESGYSFIEVTFVAGLVATLGAVASPRLLITIDDARTLGAVRYVSAVLQQVRLDAALRHRDAALRIAQTGSSYSFAEYVDGNANGVKSADISSGVDRENRRPERLPDQFQGV